MVRTRTRLLLFVGLAMLGFVLMLFVSGQANLWKALGVPAMIPHFADASIFGSATESRALGFDPLYSNPREPEGRLLPYPRVWQLLNISPAGVPWFVAALIALFIVGVGLMLWAVPNTNPAVIIPVLLSPAVLFGIERGNVDLVIFFILSLAAFVTQYGCICALVCVLLAFVLKLFPVCATVVLLRFRRGVFLAGSVVAMAFVIFWIFFTLEDTQVILKTAIRDADWSYGKDVLSIKVIRNREFVGQVVAKVSLALALGLMAFAATALPKRVAACSQTTDRSIDYFRIGASVYTATFFLGSNYNYKLVFLIFVIPQLQFWWSHAQAEVRIPARVALCTAILLVWGLFFDSLALSVPYGYYLMFVSDELFGWALFASLLYLFCLSAPEWVKEIALGCASLLRGQKAA